MARFTINRRNGQEVFNLFDEAGANILPAAELLGPPFDDRPAHQEPRLEKDGVGVPGGALLRLFATEIDRRGVYRWKYIFERIEQAIDACERAANILETILVKHA